MTIHGTKSANISFRLNYTMKQSLLTRSLDKMSKPSVSCLTITTTFKQHQTGLNTVMNHLSGAKLHAHNLLLDKLLIQLNHSSRPKIPKNTTKLSMSQKNKANIKHLLNSLSLHAKSRTEIQ